MSKVRLTPLIFLGLTAFAPLCLARKEQPVPIPSVSAPPLEQGESWTPQDEENTQKLIQILGEKMRERSEGQKTMHRGMFSHHHGCVTGLLKIDPKALPPEQRVGIFGNPHEQKAWIRFSNASGDGDQKDSEPDIRGMAVKVMNVPHTPTGTQDLLMINSKVYFIKDTGEFLDFIKATDHFLSMMWFLFRHPRAKEILNAARQMNVGNPLQTDYYSASAYKLGNRSMHFGMVSCVAPRKRERHPASPYGRYLRDRLVGTLARGDSCFKVVVQLSSATGYMPVDDPSIGWDETVYPYKEVGQLTIPKQEHIEDKKQLRFCEHLNFDPWHTAPEERPLGALNRMRLQSYAALAGLRDDYSRFKQSEPTDFTITKGRGQGRKGQGLGKNKGQKKKTEDRDEDEDQDE